MRHMINIAELTAYGLIMLALCCMACGQKTVQTPEPGAADVSIIKNI